MLHLLRQELDSKAIRALLLSIERFIMSMTSQKKNLNHCLLVKIAAGSELMSFAVDYVIKQSATAMQHGLLISKATRLEEES